MQASRALARLALDVDAHQPIMMSGALQHILALAKQDHLDPLRLDGVPLQSVASSCCLMPCDTGTLALSKLGVASACRPIILNHLSDALASPAGLPEGCRRALAEVRRGALSHVS